MQFANGHHDMAVHLQTMFRKRLEDASCRGEGDFAAVAVEEAGAGFILE